MEGQKKSFFDGAFGRYVLPGIVLQSVLMGGGFATGREIVEYGAKYGAVGWIGGIGIFIGFIVMAILSFELARYFKAYDYRSLLKNLIGRAWVLYDIVYLLLAILIIAVMASATGEILNNTLGLNYWVGVFAIAAIVGLLNFYGKGVIERFKTFGTVALFIGYVVFAALVIGSTWDDAQAILASGNTSFMDGEVMVWSVLWSGILYVGYNLAVFPAALFTVKRQKSRKESVISGIIAGVLMTIPWFLTYFSLLGFYPSEGVLSASVPWLEMLQGYGGWVVVLFGIVVGWTLIETATGMIHAFLERVNTHMEEKSNKQLSKGQSGAIAIGALILSIIFAQIGIIDLIAIGYTWMAYAMIAIYAIPMLTIGVYHIVKSSKKNSQTAEETIAK
ncbi:hypothetical protein NC797_15665 [Aquibacillus sp. 3ASR75-11]|uniref:Membrane protein YkvI n=1 Tax=Terrihalobacillus insolitus TaxID=2950438 RepID=A0A9X3WWQ3_9BACI|nr:hypothetical protein [Terrihalobacillus insolitus]MDC3413775.1 hypothetical protein [Terrihalobacillus insolitus]MDC3425943.1 hypothetical protein [Terrihalobacillus insolitus]